MRRAPTRIADDLARRDREAVDEARGRIRTSLDNVIYMAQHRDAGPTLPQEPSMHWSDDTVEGADDEPAPLAVMDIRACTSFCAKDAGAYLTTGHTNI